MAYAKFVENRLGRKARLPVIKNVICFNEILNWEIYV